MSIQPLGWLNQINGCEEEKKNWASKPNCKGPGPVGPTAKDTRIFTGN